MQQQSKDSHVGFLVTIMVTILVTISYPVYKAAGVAMPRPQRALLGATLLLWGGFLTLLVYPVAICTFLWAVLALVGNLRWGSHTVDEMLVFATAFTFVHGLYAYAVGFNT